MAIFRDLVSNCLQQEAYKVTCASSGEEALAGLAKGRPDLILLDLNMPRMDGLTMLRHVREQKGGQEIPVILLTSTVDKRHVLDAAKLGVKGYLLKDKFSLDELLSRIGQTLDGTGKKAKDGGPPAAVGAAPASPAVSAAAATASAPVAASAGAGHADVDEAAEALAKALGVPRLLTREQCLERAEKALKGKALSGVVAQVIQLAASPRSELSAVADSISHDAMLAAKILRVANSAVYTTARGPVTSIPDAIRKIGVATVRNIAATISVFEAMPEGGGKGGFDPMRSWQHSFAVAVLCERLASKSEKAEEGDAAIGYLAGLCHDLGEILFQTCFGEEYKQVFDAQVRTGHPMGELEKAMLGMPSSELILFTLRSLQLPDAIRMPIEAMHSATHTHDRLCLILRLADICANGMQLASSVRSPVRSFTTGECARALGAAGEPKLDRETIRAEIFALTALLSRGNEVSATKPLLERGRAKVWLVREPGLSKLDPMEAALESLSDVRVTNRLPIGEQMADIKALVVAGASSGGGTAQNLSAFRASCKKNLPILWLVCQNEIGSAQVESNGLRPVGMPVSLEFLANFVAG